MIFHSIIISAQLGTNGKKIPGRMYQSEDQTLSKFQVPSFQTAEVEEPGNLPMKLGPCIKKKNLICNNILFPSNKMRNHSLTSYFPESCIFFLFILRIRKDLLTLLQVLGHQSIGHLQEMLDFSFSHETR